MCFSLFLFLFPFFFFLFFLSVDIYCGGKQSVKLVYLSPLFVLVYWGVNSLFCLILLLLFWGGFLEFKVVVFLVVFSSFFSALEGSG